MVKNKIVKNLTGEVIGNKMTSTVKIVVETPTAHPKYKKVLYKKRFFKAHTDKPLNIGDKVEIMSCRPYSKTIKWVVIK